MPSAKTFSASRGAVRVCAVNRILLALLLGLVALGAARPALAHATSTSYLLIELPRGEQPVALRWDLATHDIMWSVFIDQDYDGIITWQEVVDARARYIEPAVLREIAVARGGAACAVDFKDLALAERAGQNHLSIALSAACPKSGLLTVSGSLFMTGDASQRVLISSTRGRQQFAGVISPDSPGWTEPARISAWDSFVRFVGEGVWHVLIGYDHIAFVLLLLLPSVLRPVNGQWQGAQRLSQVAREIFTIITAFTLAHSTTLALAVTGVVHLPTQPIEVAIAASIAWPAGSTCCRGCRACDCRWPSDSGSYTASALPTRSARSMPRARLCCRCWRDSTSAWRSRSWPSWRWCCRLSTWRAARAGMPRA